MANGPHMEVHNTWTRLHNLDPFIANVLDGQLRYPTEVSRVREAAGVPLQGDYKDDWDGWIRLLFQPKLGQSCYHVPTGLLALTQAICRKVGYPYTVADCRIRPEPGERFVPPIPLRDYQKVAVKAALDASRGVLDSPPRSGKTRMLTEVINTLGLPTIWVAPTDRICKQTLDVLSGFLGKHRVMHLQGRAMEREGMTTPVVVATMATASILSKEFYATRQVLAVDEWHHAAARSYQAMFERCPHIFYRWGMTGTNYRSGTDGMAMNALLSNTVYKITSSELLQRGHLIPVDVVFLPANAQKMRGCDGWQEIVRYGIWECTGRNHLAAWVAAYLANRGRKVLMLCNRKTQGVMLRDMLYNWLPKKTHPASQFSSVEFCSTDMAKYRVDQVIDSFNQLDEIKVLIGTSMLGEGVDMPAADALVYARGGAAEVSLVQNAFRVCTATEGKAERALIVDFADGHNRTLRDHARGRMGTYCKEPIFQAHVLPGTAEFRAWLAAAGHAAPDGPCDPLEGPAALGT